MKFFKDELKKIRAFVFDVDGVLSHQSQNLTPDGELIRTSCTKDGYAIMYAIRKGYIIAVISGGGAPGVRERLEKLGFKVDRTFESHPTDQAGADHGIKDGCNMKPLGSYPEIRQIWVNHLYENWNDDSAWENGEDYQPEA